MLHVLNVTVFDLVDCHRFAIANSCAVTTWLTCTASPENMQVCSPDGLLDADTLSVIQGDINKIFSGEPPYSPLYCPATELDTAVEVLAVIVDKVDGPGDAPTRVKRFAKGVHNRFGVGSRKCGSGIVVAVSVDDRQVHSHIT
jgi:Modulator of levamisole receptor-1